MKNYKQDKPAKDLHEYSVFHFLGLGSLTGIFLGAFSVSLLGSAGLVFGVTLGLFVGFSAYILVRHY